MDVLILLTALIALWALGVFLAVSLCVASGKADRDSARGRWLAPVGRGLDR